MSELQSIFGVFKKSRFFGFFPKVPKKVREFFGPKPDFGKRVFFVFFLRVKKNIFEMIFIKLFANFYKFL